MPGSSTEVDREPDTETVLLLDARDVYEVTGEDPRPVDDGGPGGAVYHLQRQPQHQLHHQVKHQVPPAAEGQGTWHVVS